MGSYCELYLDGYQIDTAKSYIHPFWSCIFKERDRITRQVHFSEYYTEAIFDTDMVPTNEYSATVETVKKRLELLGYTLDKTKICYSLQLKRKIEEVEESISDDSYDYFSLDLKYLKQLQSGGFDYWLKIAKEIMFERKIQHWNIEAGESKDTDICIWAVDNYERPYMGFPETRYGYFLRAALEAAENSSKLVLDITSLVYAGYYADDEHVCDDTAKGYINSTLEFEKIILLTEGSTDSTILSGSLNLLYPDLADYFSIMDFGPMKPEGGISALERTVKSFAAAGINNKIIAIFDNDAAGHSAIQRLATVPLPENIRIISLPELLFAKSYPTIGPQGNTSEDVNGRACSIELYLGKDIIIENDELVPVIWKGFEHKIKAYQGEIESKNEIQNRFYDKLKQAESSGDLNKHDWSSLQLIFEYIFLTAGDM